MTLTYSQRAKLTSNPIAIKLFTLMDVKKSNLAFSADVTTCKELLDLANKLGPFICVLKIHIDIITDFDYSCIRNLQHLARLHQFLIFEDRKFADIGNTVKQQYSKGIYRISNWADIVTVHAISGPGVLDALKSVSNHKSCLLLLEMSSKDNLITPNYSMAALKMAETHKGFVMGFVTQTNLSNDPGFIKFTPGIQFHESKDNLGQLYKSPHEAIFKNHSDVIIVGRGIYNSKNVVESAQKYRDAGWNAYQERLQISRL